MTVLLMVVGPVACAGCKAGTWLAAANNASQAIVNSGLIAGTLYALTSTDELSQSIMDFIKNLAGV